MTIKKDIIISEIVEQFEQLSEIILSQLDLLNNIIESHTDDIPNKLIEQIIVNEQLVDNFEIEMDAQIIKTIVLHKPVASELRQLFAIYRMVISLERIGDRVVKIMYYIINIKDKQILKKMSLMLQPMLNISIQMVRNALISYTNKDKDYALWTMKKDNTLDELIKKLVNKSINNSEFPKDFQVLLVSFSDIMGIISSIERIGDQATNIAETAIYAILGKDIRHHNIDTKDI